MHSGFVDFRFFLCAALLILLTAFAQSEAQAQSRVDFHLLPAVSTGPLDPAWSPDSSRIAFAMRGDIWVIPADGGTARALTAGPLYHSEPAWSPGGERIAMTVDNEGNLDVAVLELTTGKVEVLTEHADDDFAPAWSADGRSLFFVTRRSGDLDILRLDLATGETSPVAVGAGNQYQPALSPDGETLAYVATVPERIGSGGLWVMPAMGGEPRLVHYEESSYRMKPHWSADGASLYYSSDVRGSNNIARVPSTGGNRVWITEDAADQFDVAPSPDGARIAFVSNADGSTTLHLTGTSGGNRPLWESVSFDRRETGRPMGLLRGRVLDTDGNVVPARLMLTASDGRAYTEEGAFHRIVPATRTHYQHSDGTFQIELPAGRAQVEAMRGFEFLPGSARVEVPENGVVDVDLVLKELDTPRERGWYSGDMHVHDLHEGRFGITHEDFFRQLQADDLGVANALIHMDGTKLMGRWADLTGEVSPLSTERNILRYSQEYRGYFGHFALVGLNTFELPFIGGVPNTPYAPDILGLEHIDAARAQGAIAGFVHPFNGPVSTPEEVGRRDLPVLAALGKGDFYDVISVASTELESAEVYYRLLNSGIRLAATGGTDNFSDVWFDPSGGAARTYARLEAGEPFTVENWLKAVRAGKTFASSGPLLFLTVAGKAPGDSLNLSELPSGWLDVTVEASSIAPLERIELLVNGRVMKTWTQSPEENSWEFSTQIEPPRAGWIAVRAIGPQSRYVGDAFAFAQTSPVYLTREGESGTSAEDAAFLAKAVDVTWALAQARDLWQNESQKAAFEQGIREAREFYQRVALSDPMASVFSEAAPERFTAEFETTKGDVVIEMRREWSPRGVDRFYNLLRFGYYDDMRIHRIREGDFVQWGIHGDPAIAQAWRVHPIEDDPVKASNLRGTIAFAHGEPADDRTTQVYINLRDKPEMDSMDFSVMGRVVSGMDVADSLYADYAEAAGGGIRGGKQDPVFEGGNAYLDENFPKLDRILRARIVDESSP
jgi:cyclophilin family peptidyl-prolyl cis-trans isomerase